MKLGKLDLGNKLILAPMAEVTYAPFRIISKEYGAGLTFTQMVSAEGVIKNNFTTLRYLVFDKKEKPIGTQILGKDPDIIGDAVAELKQYRPDVIDLNCGCSVSKVCNHKMGARLLEDPNLLGRIVKKMVDNAGDVPITVKLRLGYRRKNINILDNVRTAEENGASAVIVHARTSEDTYKDAPDWSWFPKIKEAVNIPVIGNGSVFTASDAVSLIKDYGVDSVMVARGALGNPFIFSRFHSMMDRGIDPGKPEIEELKKLIEKYIQYSIENFGEKDGVNRVKKHVIWCLKEEPGLDFILQNIFSVLEADKLEDLIHQHFEKLENDSYPATDPAIVEKQFRDRVLFWSQLTNESFIE